MHIRIIVMREKIEEYPYLMHKLTQLSQSVTIIDGSIIFIPSGEFRALTAILESNLICYGIESDVELPLHPSKTEKGKSH